MTMDRRNPTGFRYSPREWFRLARLVEIDGQMPSAVARENRVSEPALAQWRQTYRELLDAVRGDAESSPVTVVDDALIERADRLEQENLAMRQLLVTLLAV